MLTLEEVQQFMKDNEDDLSRGARLILIGKTLGISYRSVWELEAEGAKVLPSSSVLGAWRAVEGLPDAGDVE